MFQQHPDSVAIQLTIIQLLGSVAFQLTIMHVETDVL
jgi:hypothetical protein